MLMVFIQLPEVGRQQVPDKYCQGLLQRGVYMNWRLSCLFMFEEALRFMFEEALRATISTCYYKKPLASNTPDPPSFTG